MSRARKKKSRNKKKKYELNDYVIIIFTTALIILSLVGAFNSFMILEKKEFFSYVIVYNHYGFDINATAITFGMITPGGSATRSITTENKYSFPVEVQIVPRGEISNFVSKQKVIVYANETKEISISVYAPKTTKYGNYTGSIYIVVKRYLF